MNGELHEKAGLPVKMLEVFDALATLNDRSLVVYDENSGRYHLLETVRQYGRELLDQNLESQRLRDSHLNYFLNLVGSCEPKLKSGEQLIAQALLESEIENVRAALEWALAGDGSEDALRIAADLAIFWWRQGHLVEGTEWCMRTLATPKGSQRTVLRARVLDAAALLSTFQGNYIAAREYYEESHGILSDLGDRQFLHEALTGLGFAHFFLDDYAKAKAFLSDALALSKENGDRWYEAITGYMRGIISRIEGDFEGALAAYREAIKIYREIGDRIGGSYPIYDVGLAEFYQGNLDSASKFLEESLAIRRETNDAWGVAESLFGLGSVLFASRDFQAARDRFEESKLVAQTVGDKARISICLHYLGRISLALGDTRAARVCHEESLSINQALEDRWGLAHCLAAYAEVAAHEKDWTAAVTLWSQSEKVRNDIDSPLPPIERTQRDEQLAAARKAMQDDAFHEAWAAGQSMTLQDAIAMLDQFKL